MESSAESLNRLHVIFLNLPQLSPPPPPPPPHPPIAPWKAFRKKMMDDKLNLCPGSEGEL